MSYTFYKLIHIFGIFMSVVALGAIASHILQGGTKANFLSRKKAGMLHGLGLTMAFIAGFGLMARGGFSFATDHWVWAKLVLWLLLGAYPAFFYKSGQKRANALLVGFLAILLGALITVEYKIF